MRTLRFDKQPQAAQAPRRGECHRHSAIPTRALSIEGYIEATGVFYFVV